MGWWKRTSLDYRYTVLLPPDTWTLPRQNTRRYLFRALVVGSLAAAAILTAVSVGRTVIRRIADVPAGVAGLHRWKYFPILDGYYSGLNDGNEDESGAGKAHKSRVFSPYPDFGSREYGSLWKGEYRECGYGLDKSGRERGRPEVRVFDGVPEGMPAPALGGYEVVGLDQGVCFDRYGRLGAYGYGYSVERGGLGVAEYKDEEAVETAWGKGGMPVKEIDWRGVDWGRLQMECIEKNRDRFKMLDRDDGDPEQVREPDDRGAEGKWEGRRKREGGKNARPRAAVLLRTWTGYEYKPSDFASIRSLISELAINSGGEFTVHLLVHVKDNKLPIWASKAVYRKTVRDNVPEEFWGIAELWSEGMMATIYNNLTGNRFLGLPLRGVYRSSFMPVQDFAYRHPEYDYVWNWEMDVRFIGNYYELFSKLGAWAEKQPRKHLWERNERYYIPSVHGTWDNFSGSVSVISSAPGSVWGPVPVEGVKIFETDPKPPFPAPEQDEHSTWGVGEPADLITLNPIINPEGTGWGLSSDTTGYDFPVGGVSPTGPPRRTAIVAVNRFSRKLLLRMHAENAFHGHAMSSEMWPPSVALQHGLKAVFAPHPIFMDRTWPPKFIHTTFNSGANGSSGGRRSVFGYGEHNFAGASWYYNANFPAKLWKRWAGLEVDGQGGESYERVHGRMCLRSVLLHPVKDMEV